jgi:hypothetical protein
MGKLSGFLLISLEKPTGIPVAQLRSSSYDGHASYQQTGLYLFEFDSFFDLDPVCSSVHRARFHGNCTHVFRTGRPKSGYG